ncbi:hypothetical protein [Streptomyces yangpuensis]|uniref:hypothetical protein n=1 Tax=Streptomyces yangpuensis TaxID=1648182 RepID=UPI0037203E3E
MVPDDEYGQLDTGALADLIDERTRLVGVAHLPGGGGLVSPAARIGERKSSRTAPATNRPTGAPRPGSAA